MRSHVDDGRLAPGHSVRHRGDRGLFAKFRKCGGESDHMGPGFLYTDGQVCTGETSVAGFQDHPPDALSASAHLVCGSASNL